MRYSRVIPTVCAMWCGTITGADEDAFLDANILSVFYHELAHAIIDLMHIPIYGQEEDAADLASVLMIDWFFEEDAAQSIAYDSAFGYIADPDTLDNAAYWDVHGPDEQRYYNHVCLFYGANPDEREDLAEALGLPDTRAETCPEEYDLASESWGPVFDALEDPQLKGTLRVSASKQANAARISDVLLPEVEQLNREFRFPMPVEVRIETCGEANAFYDPVDVSITFCTEFFDLLSDAYKRF